MRPSVLAPDGGGIGAGVTDGRPMGVGLGAGGGDGFALDEGTGAGVAPDPITNALAAWKLPRLLKYPVALTTSPIVAAPSPLE
ncbi:MAG: hypothetical protein NVSMB64_18250 [Candidatus Velthaea sp.]